MYHRDIADVPYTRPATWTPTGRQSLLSIAGAVIGRWLRYGGAKIAAGLQALFRLLLMIAGFGLISYAAWMLAVPAGLVAAGLSCLVLEWAVKR